MSETYLDLFLCYTFFWLVMAGLIIRIMISQQRMRRSVEDIEQRLRNLPRDEALSAPISQAHHG